MKVYDVAITFLKQDPIFIKVTKKDLKEFKKEYRNLTSFGNISIKSSINPDSEVIFNTKEVIKINIKAEEYIKDKKQIIEIYTDGSSSVFDGQTVGGWGCIVVYKNRVINKFSGTDTGDALRTELYAIAQGLRRVTEKSNIIVYSDSQPALKKVKDYIANPPKQPRLISLKKREEMDEGELRAISTANLMASIYDEICFHHNVSFRWVQGHNGNSYNEMANSLAIVEREIYTNKLKAKKEVANA